MCNCWLDDRSIASGKVRRQSGRELYATRAKSVIEEASWGRAGDVVCIAIRVAIRQGRQRKSNTDGSLILWQDTYISIGGLSLTRFLTSSTIELGVLALSHY